MTSISKNVYIHKLHDKVSKYDNTCHSKIKVKSFDVESSTYINFNNKIIRAILNLKLVIM